MAPSVYRLDKHDSGSCIIYKYKYIYIYKHSHQSDNCTMPVPGNKTLTKT